MRFLTIFFGGVLRIFEKDLKKIIALRTLSQIRFCFFLFSFEFYFFSVIHLISHAFFKSSLFIQRGYFMYYSFGEQNKNFSNFNFSLINFRFFINILSLIGIFFNRGIIRKDFLLEIFRRFNFKLIFFIFRIIIIFTFIYRFILLNIIFNLFLNFNKKKKIFFSFFRSNFLNFLSIIFIFIFINNNILNFLLLFLELFFPLVILFFLFLIFLKKNKLFFIFISDFFILFFYKFFYYYFSFY
jgi:NADH-quinone oxidoreductase subunit L